MKLNLRDFFWLIFLAAVVTMWWQDRTKLADRREFYELLKAHADAVAVRVAPPPLLAQPAPPASVPFQLARDLRTLPIPTADLDFRFGAGSFSADMPVNNGQVFEDLRKEEEFEALQARKHPVSLYPLFSTPTPAQNPLLDDELQASAGAKQ